VVGVGWGGGPKKIFRRKGGGPRGRKKERVIKALPTSQNKEDFSKEREGACGGGKSFLTQPRGVRVLDERGKNGQPKNLEGWERKGFIILNVPNKGKVKGAREKENNFTDGLHLKEGKRPGRIRGGKNRARGAAKCGEVYAWGSGKLGRTGKGEEVRWGETKKLLRTNCGS